MDTTILVDGIEVPIGTHKGKTIVIGSDHRGFEYKESIVRKLKEKGYEIEDVGIFSKEKCDYPLISEKIGKNISQDYLNRVGIGICGSGIGILIPASKHKRVYAARCLNKKEAETSRKHNNTNMLGIGADYMDFETVLETIFKWLETPFYSNPEEEGAYLKRYIQTVKIEEHITL
jgi:ribose 5-phosphate isomerase B